MCTLQEKFKFIRRSICTGVLLALVAKNVQADESFWEALLAGYSQPEDYLVWVVIGIFGYIVSRLFARSKK